MSPTLCSCGLEPHREVRLRFGQRFPSKPHASDAGTAFGQLRCMRRAGNGFPVMSAA